MTTKDCFGSSHGLIKAVYILMFALWIARGATIPVTIDEACTVFFAESFEWTDWIEDANFHPLNSLWVAASLKLFGLVELGHRFANLLAGGLYLWCCWRIGSVIAGRDDIFLRIILIANPFLNDMFSLARGYGIALGLLALLIAWVTRCFGEQCKGRALPAAIIGGLTVAANYSFAMVVVPMVATVLFQEARLHRWRTVALAAVVMIVWLVAVGLISQELRAKGLLYYGGRTSFIKDTVGSSISAFCYGVPYRKFAESICIVLVVLGVAWGCMQLAVWSVGKQESSRFLPLIVSLVSCIAVSVFGAILGGLPFLVERTALGVYLVTVVTWYALCMCHWVRNGGRWKRRIEYGAAGILLAHTLYCTGLWYSYSWFWDASSRAFLTQLKSDRERHVVGTSAHARRSLLYYIRQLGVEDRITVVSVDSETTPFYTGIASLDGEYYGLLELPVDWRTPFFANMFQRDDVTDWYLLDIYVTKAVPADVNVQAHFGRSRMVWLKRDG